MKIVHISMADFNGAGLCAYRICKAQRALGMDSRMVVLKKKHKDDFIETCGEMTYFLHSVLRKIKKLSGIHDDLNACRELGKIHNAVYTLPISPIDLTKVKTIREADIIHLHWVGGFLDYRTFFEAFKRKVIVVTMHDENLLYGLANIEKQWLPDNPLEQKYYRLKYKEIQKVDRFGAVFLSRMGFRLYGEHEMLAKAKKRIIYNMVDNAKFRPFPKSEARRRLGLSENDKLFAFCACNINERRKGLAELSEALLHINPDYKVLAIGKNRGEIKWANVKELGRISEPEEMSRVFSAADYFCMPSFKENFAQAPLEAMACGLPVIAFPCSGMEELITEENGVRCDDFTVEALENGIRKAMTTQYDGTAIRKDMMERFSPEKIAGEYINFYEEIIKEKA
ncbi:glycosyltransferase [Prevotella brunnea]|uniref:Glycosyltransferase n=1 Tax=Prevotella brunnea TaxID=2508867 RepID=A0A5C8GG72_9BACT|nr:glycosyltransferase [Prevotella brunnea]MDR0185623.1 glycosyltransferase [Prevotella brunnea]TXJ60917.1 glycosyltransferase [Prevotella brunnea]